MGDPRHIGKYKILEEIGRGAFATVYKAHDPTLDRFIALKVLHPHWAATPDFVARFRHEARASAQLRHPHIVTVYEADEADGQLYIAMEYLPGRTLRALLEDEGSLPLERVLPILEQIAGALDCAHGRSVVHRDVKPANIMVEETTQGIQATLTDFGLVKAMEGSSALTSCGTLLGSPEYMAPEQADPQRAAKVGPAADRYALGVVAYRMLTGQVPFPGDTPATLNAHLNLDPPDPRDICQDLPRAVADALLRMLAKRPADRFASASAFVARLRKVQQEEQQEYQSPQARAHYADPYTPYEVGLGELRKRLGPDHPRYPEVLVYQVRLIENIDQTREFGDTETRRAERAEIVKRLDAISLSTLKVPFSDLCRPVEPPGKGKWPPLDEKPAPLPLVHMFEPLRPFNSLLINKFRLDGIAVALLSWVTFLLLYAGGIWAFRRIMNTPYPQRFVDLLVVAPGSAFYYPDWNAMTFDVVLNPALVALASTFPLLMAKRLTLLLRSNLLQPSSGSRGQLLELSPWAILGSSLLFAIVTVAGSWFSRYQFYFDDPLAFRLYVLFLVGLSTYVRWSLLIVALQTTIWVFRCEFRPNKELLSRGGEAKVHPLGELGILLFLVFHSLIAYAVATIGTSVVKGVLTAADALFWEAVAHLLLSLLGCGLAFVGLVHRPCYALQRLQDDFIRNEIAQIVSPLEQRIPFSAAERIPMFPVLRSAQRQAYLLVPFLLFTSAPLLLLIIGIVI